jgi:putative flippase GtrA
MQAVLERLLGEALARLAMQFLRFGTVGAAGFVVDTAVVYGLRGAIGIYAAGAAAYCVAATFTWFFNRLWTFRSAPRGAAGRQWMLFLATQCAGFVVNRGVFALLVTFSPFCATYPAVAIAAGVAAGMFLNFAAAKRFVFAQG